MRSHPLCYNRPWSGLCRIIRGQG